MCYFLDDKRSLKCFYYCYTGSTATPSLFQPNHPKQFICSYVFWPLAYIMGVAPDDCGIVAELIGTKALLNEFVVSYMYVGQY